MPDIKQNYFHLASTPSTSSLQTNVCKCW